MRGRRAVGPAAAVCARSRTPGIGVRRICRRMSIRAGWRSTVGYKPQRDTGTFSYAAHAAVVAVDPETGRCRDPRLRRRRGRRRAGQPDDRRRPDLWRSWRRASAPRCTRRCRSTRQASRWPRPWRTICCPARPRCRTPRIDPHGDAVALYAVRPEGHRRGRGHRAAGRDRQRRQRCAARVSASRLLRVAGHAAPRRWGNPGRPAMQKGPAA